MEIVVAEPEQVDAMVAITEQARANMAAMGIDQWQCGYPDRGTWEADVAAGAAYVALDEGRVVAVNATMKATAGCGSFHLTILPTPSGARCRGRASCCWTG